MDSNFATNRLGDKMGRKTMRNTCNAMRNDCNTMMNAPNYVKLRGESMINAFW